MLLKVCFKAACFHYHLVTVPGYWLPFEAAKAITATFAYNIRYALTPLFGPDFVDLCRHPESSNYADFKISKEIIAHCIAEAESWRPLTMTDRSFKNVAQSPKRPLAPTTPPRARKWRRRQGSARGEVESGYCTDTDSDRYKSSPNTSTSVFGDVSREKLSILLPPVTLQPSSIRQTVKQVPQMRNANMSDNDAHDGYISETSPSGPQEALKGRPGLVANKETKAAYVIMQLNFADNRR